MRVVLCLLAIVPTVLCQGAGLEPEDVPKPTVSGFSTIKGVCDASAGVINGASFSGAQGTLKACSKACADNSQCQGLNFVTDQNQCQLFRTACDNTQRPEASAPTQNFYLKGEIACSRSTVGNEFYLAFMANRVAQPQNKSLEIWLTQDKEAAGTTVLLETDPSAGLTRNITVPYKTAVSTLIPFTWKLSDVDNGVTIEKKALRLTSATDFVFYGVNKEYFTADAFLGIPSRALGTRYVANCHWPPFYNCEFAITPTDDDTTIRVTLPRQPTRNLGNWAKPPTGIPNVCKIPYKGRDYTNGDTFEIKLNRFEAAQIQDPCDLTGAIIESDKPIAVWSGDSRVNVGDSPSRDHQVEGLFSTDTWGTDCAAWPTPNRVAGLTDYWVITAAEDNTVVKVESSEKDTVSYNLNAAQSVRFPANSVTEWQRFSSTKKFQAVQYAHSAVDNSIPGDPSMTVCIPSDQFGFGYTFVTPTGVSSPYTNFLTIITTRTATAGFILDGQPIVIADWKSVPNSNLVGGVVRLNPAKTQFRIEHRVKGTTFEAYIFGSGDRESIAYPTGACIKALGECTTTTMVIADGLDNDCDGVIDEELCGDKIDNDLDGKIDEDCYARKPTPRNDDRCPETKIAQACHNGQLSLSCESGTINVVQANYGRVGRLGEKTCSAENAMDACSGSDADCGFEDFSDTIALHCDSKQTCSVPAHTYASWSACPKCSLYAHVQYVCLTEKEQNSGNFAPRKNFKASSYLATTVVGNQCGKAGGLQNGDTHAPKQAYQFGTNAVEAWRPAQCDKNTSWVQIDLGSSYAVGWYLISGCRRNDFWTTKFAISHSQDGKTWTVIRDASGEPKLFDGNSDAITSKVCTLFQYNIVARYLRIHPIEYNGYPCAHVDFGHSDALAQCDSKTVARSNFANGGSAARGMSAMVTCNKGFATPRGETSYNVRCGADGQWAGEFRDCSQLLYCQDIPSIEGGYGSATGTQSGATVRYRCLSGRTLRGADQATCRDDGTWSQPAPTCEAPQQ